MDDYHALLAVLGQTGDRWTDFNEDGRVDINDFALMRSNFGSEPATAPLSTDRHTTPEPASMLFVLAGALAVLKRRRFCY